MKKLFFNPLILLLLLLFMMVGCSPMYQLLETKSEDTSITDTRCTFTNTDVLIEYNFWENGGQLSFMITNNHDTPLYIDWDRSHFIFNGISYEYWYDEEVTKSFYSSSTASNGYTIAEAMVTLLTGTSTSGYRSKTTQTSSSKIRPKQILELPPHSSIFVSKFSITKDPYYTCDFSMRYVANSKSKSLNFTKDNSPISFRNYLTYATNASFSQPLTADNSFYVGSVSNMNQKVFFGKQQSEKYCLVNGKKMLRTFYGYPYKKTSAFYILKYK
ncbi:MAG: hypothetical protein ABJB16_02150 [Saprospiraceae bacterium]